MPSGYCALRPDVYPKNLCALASLRSLRSLLDERTTTCRSPPLRAIRFWFAQRAGLLHDPLYSCGAMPFDYCALLPAFTLKSFVYYQVFLGFVYVGICHLLSYQKASSLPGERFPVHLVILLGSRYFKQFYFD
jgi:hypothetical protein